MLLNQNDNLSRLRPIDCLVRPAATEFKWIRGRSNGIAYIHDLTVDQLTVKARNFC